MLIQLQVEVFGEVFVDEEHLVAGVADVDRLEARDVRRREHVDDLLGEQAMVTRAQPKCVTLALNGEILPVCRLSVASLKVLVQSWMTLVPLLEQLLTTRSRRFVEDAFEIGIERVERVRIVDAALVPLCNTRIAQRFEGFLAVRLARVLRDRIVEDIPLEVQDIANPGAIV